MLVRKIKKNRFLNYRKVRKKLQYDLSLLLAKFNKGFFFRSSSKTISFFIFKTLHSLVDSVNYLFFFFFLKNYLRSFFFKCFFFENRKTRFSSKTVKKQVVIKSRVVVSFFFFRCLLLYIYLVCKNLLKYLKYFRRFSKFMSFRVFLSNCFFIDSLFYVRTWSRINSLHSFDSKHFSFSLYFRKLYLKVDRSKINKFILSSSSNLPRLFIDRGVQSLFSLYRAVSSGRNIMTYYKRGFSDILLYDCTISLSKNNIFLTIYRKIDGKVITSCSAGNVGFKGKKKKTPPSATAIALKFSQQLKRKVSWKFLNKMKITLKFYGNFTSFLVKEAYNGLLKGGLSFVGLVDCLKIEHSLGIRRKKSRRV